MKKIFILLLSLFALMGCNEESSKGQGNVFSIAATSEKSGFPVELAFDGNPATAWVPAGNATGEGVTIRFIKGVKIETLSVIPAGNADAKYSVYLNGVVFGDVSGGQSLIVDKDSVYTIFIKCLSQAGGGLKEIIVNKDSITNTVVFPSSIIAKVTASSSLTPAQSYAPELAFDGRLDFGWVEGASDQGVGQFLQLDLDKVTAVDTLYIANGYQRSDSHFKKNSRVQNIEVSSDQGVIGQFTLADQAGIQTIDLGQSVNLKTLKITIKSVYPGSKYKDTVISEIKLGNKGSIINLITGFDQKISQEISSKLSSSFFKKYVGKNLVFSDENTTATLKLRNNGSFVLWVIQSDTEYEYDSEKTKQVETVRDGNWVIKEAGDTLKIQIFGREHTIRSTTERSYNPYAQDSVSEDSSVSIKIFSDNLSLVEVDELGIEEAGLMIHSTILDGEFEIQ